MADNSEVWGIFNQEFLRRLEGLSILARQLARGAQRAERRSSHRGDSPEFADYRAYVPGDDIRYIDWNAYARWRTLVRKLFVEEHDLPIHLLLDCSASMQWGDPDKFTYARQVIAGLASVGLGNHDRVGISPLCSTENQGLPVSRGKGRFWHALHLLAGYTVSHDARILEDDVRQWLLTKPVRGVVIWVSDLWGSDSGDALRSLDRLRYSRHELGVIQVIDPDEADAGALGEFRLHCAEGGASRTVIIDQRLRGQYRRFFEEYQESILRYCRRFRIPLLQTTTTLSVPNLLIRVLRAKGFVN